MNFQPFDIFDLNIRACLSLKFLKSYHFLQTDERVDIRQRVNREDRDELRRDFDARRHDESRQRVEREQYNERRSDVNRRGLCLIKRFFFLFYSY